MAISQYYETTVLDEESSLELEITSIPAKVAASVSPVEVEYELELNGLSFSPAPANHLGPFLIAHALLHPSEESSEPQTPRSPVDELRAFQFSRAVFQDALVPIENSPLKGEKLSKLLEGPATFSGTIVGLVTGHNFGSAIVVLVVTPLAIIILSAAKGVGAGLQKGLKERVADLLSPKRKRKKK